MHVGDVDPVSFRLRRRKDVEHAVRDRTCAVAHVRRVDEVGDVGRVSMGMRVGFPVAGDVPASVRADATASGIGVGLGSANVRVGVAAFASVRVGATAPEPKPPVEAVEVGRVVVVVFETPVEHHVEIAYVKPRFHHAADADLEPFEPQALKRAKHGGFIRSASRSAATVMSPLIPAAHSKYSATHGYLLSPDG